MSKLKSIIEMSEDEFYKFTPSHVFYEAVGINRKRWGMLVRGELEPTLKEAKVLAEFFRVSISAFTD